MKYKDLLDLYKSGKLSDKQAEEIRTEIEKQEAISEYLYLQSEEIFGAVDSDEKFIYNASSEKVSSHTEGAEEKEGTTETGISCCKDASLDAYNKKFSGSAKSFDGTDEGNNGNLIGNVTNDGKRMKNINSYDAIEKEIKKSIRKIFIKVGVVAGIVALVLIIFVETALPKIVDKFYFDPTVSAYTVKKADGDVSTVFDVGLAVYSELFLPHRMGLNDADISSEGYGNYNFNISKAVGFNEDKGHVYVGEINRGKIKFYNPEYLIKPVGNAFGWRNSIDFSHSLTEKVKVAKEKAIKEASAKGKKISSDEIDNIEFNMYGFGEGRKTSEKNIKASLKAGKKYQAYITFDKILDYKDAVNYEKKYNLEYCWYPVVGGKHGNHVIGMYSRFHSGITRGDLKKYPYIFGYRKNSEDTDYMNENQAKQHYISMIKFLQDNKKFSNMMGLTEDENDNEKQLLQNKIDYVKTHGLKIYGLSVLESKEKLLKLIKDKNICSIAVNSGF